MGRKSEIKATKPVVKRVNFILDNQYNQLIVRIHSIIFQESPYHFKHSSLRGMSLHIVFW